MKQFDQRKRAQQARLHPLFTLGVLAAGLGAQVGAQAQNPPDAGSLRRQIEQEHQPQLPARKAGELVKPGAVNNFLPGATRVQVKAFEFVGNRLMTDAELKALAAPWVGKSLDMASLQAVAAAVGQAYRERGWVVRSLLPRQEVKDGIIRIEIVEARFGKLTDDGTPSGRVSVEQVRAFVQNRLVHGEAVNTVPLDRGLMLADDLPGVTVSGRLVQGSQPNETDLALKITPEPLLVGDVGVDNFGSRSTGNARASANLGVNSPFGFGDQASGSLIHTKGSDFVRADYTAPVGASGLRVGADASWFRYKLVQGDFQALDSRGDSSALGVHVNYPNITQRPVTVGGVKADDKVYDGTTDATLDSSNATLGNVVGNDDVNLSGATGTFSDKNAGNGKTVNLNQTLSGADASNYMVAPSSTTTTASITPRPVTVGGVKADDKVYDGTTDATVHSDNATLGNVVGNDDVNLSSATGSFSDKNAGNGKTVNLNQTLGGNDAGNYMVAPSSTTTTANYMVAPDSTTTTANITPRPVTVGGVKADDKVYDGTTDATVHSDNATLSNVIGNDDVNLSSVTGSFADKNAGTGKTVNLNQTLGGNDASNYMVAPSSTTTTANISQRQVTVDGVTAANKVYDGTTGATVDSSNATLGNVVGNDDVNLSSATGNFSDKNAGTGKTVNLNETLGGNDAGSRPDGDRGVGAPAVAAPANGGNVMLDAAGAVSEAATAGIIAPALIVDAGGAADLAGNANLLGALAVANVGSLNLVTDGPMTIGSAGGVDGIHANGPISIATRQGDLTLEKNVSTNDSSANAVTLIAGLDAPAGTAAGGNIVINDGATVTTGDGGSATFYSGSATGDTSLGSAVGVGRSRYNSDEATTNYTTPLQAGANAIYREAIETDLMAGNVTTEYGSGNPVAPTGNLVNGDTASLLVSNASYSTSGNLAAGNYATTLSPESLAALAGLGYTVAGNSSAPGSLTVTPKSVNVAGIQAANKTYDGTTDATVDTSNATINGLISGDVVTTDATGSFSDKNAATGKTVDLVSTHGGADAGNYLITDQTSTVADITKRALTGVSGVQTTGQTKTYDGTTQVPIDTSGANLGGLLSGDQLGLNAQGTTADKNVGTDKAMSIAAQLTGADAGNYSLPSDFPTTGTVTVTPAPLNLSGMAAQNKVYDGTTTAPLDTSGASLTGVLPGDSIGYDASGAFADKNAGTAKPVNLTIGLTGADAQNYAVSSTDHLAADITPRVLTVGGVQTDGVTKTYDGTTQVPIDTSGASLGGVLGGDQLGLSALGTTADKNVGTDKAMTVAGQLTGADAGNYALPSDFPTTGTVTVTPAALNLSGLAAQNKVYDGTTDASLDTSRASLSGVMPGDSIGYDATGAFADKNAGKAKDVALTVGLTGADAQNYIVSSTDHLAADITPRVLTVGGVQTDGLTKTYDGTTQVPIDTSGASLGGVLGGDQLGLSALGNTADKNVGTDKAMTVAGQLTGADAGNYALPSDFPTTGTVTVTPAALNLSGLAAQNKVYDGTTNAPLDTSGASLSGVMPGDSIGYDATGAFADKNVGKAKDVALTLGLTGADAQNYTVSSTDPLAADITQRQVGVSRLPGADGTAVTKTYDGTTQVALDTGSATLSGLVPGDDLGLSSQGTMADKNVGTDKAMTIASQLTGADAANYALAPDVPSTGKVTVTPAHLSLTGTTAQDKVYDGTTAATVSTAGASLSGVLTGDTVGYDATGAFADKNAGNDKPVDLTVKLSGADAGNYVVDAVDPTADITKRPLTVNTPLPGTTGGSTVEKMYDGTNDVPIDTRGVQLGNVVTGDQVSLSSQGKTQDPGLGTDKPMALTNGLIGADAGNYTLPDSLPGDGKVTVTLPEAAIDAGAVDGNVGGSAGLKSSSRVGAARSLQPAAEGTPGGGAGDGWTAPIEVVSAHQPPAVTEGGEGEASRISVDLTIQPTDSNMGEVAVMVPRDMAAGSTGFAFPLPQELSKLATRDAELQVTSITGGPLPGWLSYDKSRRVIVATGVPEGALPTQVLVTIKGTKTVVSIAERPRQRRN